MDGRKVPRSFSEGFFHWTVQEGPRELVARTEVTPRGDVETYGFNCFGCCVERSFGALQPAAATFAVGASGLHTFTFGNLSSYSAGQQFDRVVADWTVSGKTGSGSRSYRFKALGSYNHTQYNTPVSNQSCFGGPVSFCYFTGGCINVQSCTGHQTAQAPSSWVTEVEENGGGFHAQLGYFTREAFCAHPGTCGHTFRKVSNPCSACSGLPVTPGATVAVNAMNNDLSCGDSVFVESVGVVQVTDHGGGLTMTQLDHYIGTGACNQASTIGQRATFLLQ